MSLENTTNMNKNNANNSATNMEDKQMYLLETLVSNQKHMIELLQLLNNNVEEMILDIKDIKSNNAPMNAIPKVQTPSSSSTCSSSSPSSSSSLHTRSNGFFNNNNHHYTHKHTNAKFRHNNENAGLLLNKNHSMTNPTLASPTTNSPQNHLISIQQHLNELNHATQQSSLLFNLELTNNSQHNQSIQLPINNNNNNINANYAATNGDSYKPIKSGLREFSTFVSKMVRQQFGSNYLAITRINELDRFVMQKIKDEAVVKHLPSGVSAQFAWNHAMNSLRQLRHRQCKKAAKLNPE